MLAIARPLINQLPFNINQVNNAVFQFLPSLGRTAFRLLPFALQKKALLTCLNSIFAEALEDGDFDFLTDQWLKIAINDLGVQWLISYQNEQLVIADNDSNQVADVCFAANGDDLLLIAARKQDPDTLFFQRRLVIEGDTELGLEIKNLIDAIDVEQLPKVLNQLLQQTATWVDNIKRQQ